MPLRTTMPSSAGHSAAAPMMAVVASAVNCRACANPVRASGSHTLRLMTT
jgi:hypothetical protein